MTVMLCMITAVAYTVIPVNAEVLSVQSPFWKKLVKNQSEIPNGQFRAYYIDTSNMQELLSQQIVSEIRLSYGWWWPVPYSGKYKSPIITSEESYSLSSERNLWVYWVWEFEFSQNGSTDVVFNIPQSGRDVFRLYVDGKLVSDSKKEDWWFISHRFEKWKHTIEAEYESFWHAGTFGMHIHKEPINIIGISDIAWVIDKITTRDWAINLFAVSAYGPDDDVTGIVNLTIPKTSAPSVLILDSYDSISWKIDTKNSGNIGAIIVTSYNGWSKIIQTWDVGIYYAKGGYMGWDNWAWISSNVQSKTWYKPNSSYYVSSGNNITLPVPIGTIEGKIKTQTSTTSSNASNSQQTSSHGPSFTMRLSSSRGPNIFPGLSKTDSFNLCMQYRNMTPDLVVSCSWDGIEFYSKANNIDDKLFVSQDASASYTLDSRSKINLDKLVRLTQSRIYRMPPNSRFAYIDAHIKRLQSSESRTAKSKASKEYMITKFTELKNKLLLSGSK